MGWVEEDNPDVEFDVTEIYKYGESKTLIPRWEEYEYVLSFDLNGGTSNGGTDTGKIVFGQQITKPTDPTPPKGYGSFKHWVLLNNSGGEDIVWDFSQPYRYNKDASLKAIYNPNTYNINMHIDNSTETTSVEFDKPYELKQPIKTGHAFIGWFEDESFKTPHIKQDVYNFDKNLDLYAKFEQSDYKIVYKLNGGSFIEGAEEQEVKYGEPFDLRTPIKDEHKFLGWYTDSSFATKYTKPETYDQGGDLTLYAKWGKTYELTVKYKTDFDKEYKEYIHPVVYNEPIDPIVLNIDGYSVEGLYKDELFSTKFEDSNYTTQGNSTIYAKLQSNNYTITVKSSLDQSDTIGTYSVDYGKQYTLPIPSKPKYTFKYFFYNDENFPATDIYNKLENIEVVAVFEQSNVDIKSSLQVFNKDDLSTPIDKTVFEKEIAIKFTPTAQESSKYSQEQVEIYINGNSIGTITDFSQPLHTKVTTDNHFIEGDNKIKATFTGNDEMFGGTGEINLKVSKDFLDEDSIEENPDGSITIPSIPVTAHPSPDGDKPVIEGKEPQKYIKIPKHGRLEFDDLLVIFPDGGKFYQDGTYKSEDRTLNITTQQTIQSLPVDQTILPTLNGSKPNYELADNPYINLPHGADIGDISITDPNEEGFIIWLQDKETYIKCPTPNKPKVQIIEKGNIRIIIPANSTIVRPDGSETLFPDGGHIDMPEGNPETNNPGGDVNKNPDGTIIVPPGITLPPSSEVEIDKDGNIVVTLPPDSSITLPDNNNTKFPDGGTIIIKPNKPDKGDAEIELPNDKPVELPNGDKITDGGTIIIDPPNVIYPNKPDGNNNNTNTGGSGAPVGKPDNKPENPDNKPENPENSVNTSPGDLGDHWAEDIINELLDKGILNGFPDGTFHPDDIIKRSDASIMVYNMLKYLKINLSTNLNSKIFEDVNEGDYYYNYVNNMAHNKIVNGYNNGLFLPNNNITREESLVIIHNLSINGYINLPNKTPKNISDLDQVSSWALDAVNYSLNKGLINGDDKGKLNPKNYITRAEFATIIYNLIQ